MIDLTLADALDGERVDRVVSMLTGLSRAASADLVASGAVAIGGRPVTTRSVRVQGGQRLAIQWEPGPAAPAVEADPSVAVTVVHADADVIVVDKAAGVVVHPGNGVQGATLVAGLLARFPELAAVGEEHRPGIVHRLDRGTSGLLVVARTAAAYDGLVAALADHRVHREYQALVIGRLATAAGAVEAPIGRSRHDPTRRAVVADGKPARTDYRLEHSYSQPEPLSLLSCNLHTGRTHQIRVHLQAIDHPVVGDVRYGGGRLTLGLDRPFLHAAALAFDHPVTGEALAFQAALPADLRVVLDELDAADR
jgi:23S rRNA pseudouridine1911/1915/1917 synthase